MTKINIFFIFTTSLFWEIWEISFYIVKNKDQLQHCQGDFHFRKMIVTQNAEILGDNI